jgi:hypothetical protein
LSHQFTQTFTDMKTQIKNFAIVCFLLINVIAQAQTEVRVSFTVTNSSLKGKYLDFKGKNSGYGYQLNGLGSHATNLIAPVRVYEERDGQRTLLFIVKAEDNGKSFSVNHQYEISKEDQLQAETAEMNEKTAALEKAKKDRTMEQIAKEKGLKLVKITVKGSSWFGSMAHVRYQLPWGNDNQLGFSSSLSKWNSRDLVLPVGTKVYQCSDKYWSSDTKFTEKLVLTVDESKENSSYSL